MLAADGYPVPDFHLHTNSHQYKTPHHPCIDAAYSRSTYARDVASFLNVMNDDRRNLPHILVIGVALWDLQFTDLQVYRDGLNISRNTLQGFLEQVCRIQYTAILQ